MMRISCPVSVWTIETGTPAGKPGEQAKCDKSLFPIGEPVILVSEGEPFKDSDGIKKVDAVLFEVERAFAL